MSNPRTAKGTEWETSAVGFLNERGVRSMRKRQTGFKDTGDIVLMDRELSDFALEAKWHNKYDLPEFVRQAERGAANAGVPFGVLLLRKLRDSDPANSFAIMSMNTFADLLLEWQEMQERISQLEALVEDHELSD